MAPKEQTQTPRVITSDPDSNRTKVFEKINAGFPGPDGTGNNHLEVTLMVTDKASGKWVKIDGDLQYYQLLDWINKNTRAMLKAVPEMLGPLGFVKFTNVASAKIALIKMLRDLDDALVKFKGDEYGLRLYRSVDNATKPYPTQVSSPFEIPEQQGLLNLLEKQIQMNRASYLGLREAKDLIETDIQLIVSKGIASQVEEALDSLMQSIPSISNQLPSNRPQFTIEYQENVKNVVDRLISSLYRSQNSIPICYITSLDLTDSQSDPYLKIQQ